MANFHIASNLRDSLAALIGTALDAGGMPATLSIYDGRQPESCNDAVTVQNLLVQIEFNYPAGYQVEQGVLSLEHFGESNVITSGIATWARAADSNGQQIFDCDVGISEATIIFPNASDTSLAKGDSFTLADMTVTVPTGE